MLGFSTQAFYKWAADPICERDFDDAHLTNAIVDIHGDDPEFGYRFIADELERAGHEVGESRVQRLCREHRIWSTTTKKGRRSSGKTPGRPSTTTWCKRDFSAPAPNLVWLTDITEHPTGEGKLYCCAIKDCLLQPDRRLCPLGSHDGGARPCLPCARRWPGANLEARWWFIRTGAANFVHEKFRAVLKANDLTGSMGRVSSAGDNAAMESFYSLLQKNVLNRRRWRSRDELAYEIIYWIEHTYNRRRRQRGLGKLTPVEYRTRLHQPAADAA